MPRKPAIILLCLLVLVVAVAAWLIWPNSLQRNYQFLPDMVDSPAYSAQSPNPNFPDGMTSQLPPPGTVARQAHFHHFAPTTQDAVRAGEELQNAFKPDDTDALARGQVIFSRFCQVCHGPQGAGDGPASRRGMLTQTLLSDRAMNLKDGQIWHIVSYGQVNMPSYASQVQCEDRWRAVLYVRTLQQQARAAAATTMPTTAPTTRPAAK